MMTEKEIRDEIDSRFEEIRLDYSCVNAYNQSAQDLIVAAELIICAAQEAVRLCKELEAP